MNHFPVPSLSPQQFQHFQDQLYPFLAQQVNSYHTHYHMGNNSSVSTETAEELIRSVRYTLSVNGGYDPRISLAEQIRSGQTILETELLKTNELLKLVQATVPFFQSQCHWETLAALEKSLSRYDHLHFAHCCPMFPDYPLLLPIPEEAEGLQRTQYILNCLWLENQILYSFPKESLGELILRYPPDYWEAPQNLCEQPLWNALGKILLGLNPIELPFRHEQISNLLFLLRSTESSYREKLFLQALTDLSINLDFTPAMSQYAAGALSQLLPRLQAPIDNGDLSPFFL